MSNLRHLDLSYIPFTGRVPRAHGNLSKLEHLDISATSLSLSLSGSVPPQLGNLSNLRYLDLGYAEDVSWLSSTST
jgi:Leucine-rich repeat (LRR) protein